MRESQSMRSGPIFLPEWIPGLVPFSIIPLRWSCRLLGWIGRISVWIMPIGLLSERRHLQRPGKCKASDMFVPNRSLGTPMQQGAGCSCSNTASIIRNVRLGDRYPCCPHSRSCRCWLHCVQEAQESIEGVLILPATEQPHIQRL